MRDNVRTLLFLSLLLLGPAVSAELVVIVNPGSNVKQMDESALVNIFMGRYQKLPSGITAFPVDLSPERETFYRKLIDKTPSEINSYWARLVFSGRASPPRQVQDATEVIEIVSNNRGAIGYVDRALVDDRVEVVYAFSP